MSTSHDGNIQNAVTIEEHQGELNAKRVSLVSAATIYAVVNTAGAGTSFQTVFQGGAPWSDTIVGNITLSDPKTYVGLVTATPSAAWPDPKTYVGLVTIDIGTQNKISILGNVSISGAISLVSGYPITGIVTIANSLPSIQSFGQFFPVPQSVASGGLGPLLLDQFGRQQIIAVGNVTLSDAKTFIGLVSLGGGTAWSDPKTYIGLASVNVANTVNASLIGNVSISGAVSLISGYAMTGNVTANTIAWVDPKTYIGLATIDIGTNNKVALVGNISISGAISLVSGYPITGIVTIAGQIAWLDPKTYIGLVTVSNAVAWPDPKTFIGLVTIIPTFMSGYTSFATVISAIGPATLIVPPAGQKIFVKDLHVSSLGRSEISAWRVNSTATAAVIPWTALSTTGGFIAFKGENGQQWGLANDGLTFALNGAATVGVAADVRFST